MNKKLDRQNIKDLKMHRRKERGALRKRMARNNYLNFVNKGKTPLKSNT